MRLDVRRPVYLYTVGLIHRLSVDDVGFVVAIEIDWLLLFRDDFEGSVVQQVLIWLERGIEESIDIGEVIRVVVCGERIQVKGTVCDSLSLAGDVIRFEIDSLLAAKPSIAIQVILVPVL